MGKIRVCVRQWKGSFMCSQLHIKERLRANSVRKGRAEGKTHGEQFPNGCPASFPAPVLSQVWGPNKQDMSALHLGPANHVPLIIYSSEVSIKSSGLVCLWRNILSHRPFYIVFTVTFCSRKAYNSKIYLMSLTIQYFDGPDMPLYCHNSRWHIEY